MIIARPILVPFCPTVNCRPNVLMHPRGHTRGTGRGGRGAYYRALYGRGGRGAGRGAIAKRERLSPEPSSNGEVNREPAQLGTVLGTKDDLENELRRLDGKSYGAYKDLKGILRFL